MAIEVYNGLYSGQELDAAVTVVNAVIPSTATAQNKLATEADISQLDTTVSGLVSDVADIQGDIDNILDDVSDLDTSVSTINSTITDIQGDITDIDGKIPSAATVQNQLADKDYVNSSVSTNTANYISNNGEPFTSVAALEAYSGTVTNNDYAFVTGTDSAGNTYYDRYKATVSGATVTWAKEYRLNNSSFTSTQWASINSGITSGDVSAISSIQAVIPSTATSSNKLATMADIPSGGSGIAGVQINGVDLTPDANNKVDIPMSGSMVLGVIKTSPTYCTDIGTSGSNLTGELCASEVQYVDYASLDDSAFIAKGTLDNVLAGMSLDDVSDETWTFVVDDGQGGTTTVTKTVKVGT